MFRNMLKFSCANCDRLANFRHREFLLGTPEAVLAVGQLPENGHRSGLRNLAETKEYLELGDAICGLQRTCAQLDDVNRQSRRGNWTHIDHARMARVILKSLLKT